MRSTGIFNVTIHKYSAWINVDSGLFRASILGPLFGLSFLPVASVSGTCALLILSFVALTRVYNLNNVHLPIFMMKDYKPNGLSDGIVCRPRNQYLDSVWFLSKLEMPNWRNLELALLVSFISIPVVT